MAVSFVVQKDKNRSGLLDLNHLKFYTTDRQLVNVSLLYIQKPYIGSGCASAQVRLLKYSAEQYLTSAGYQDGTRQ